MNFKDYFERFWKAKGQYLPINNKNRIYENLCKKMSTKQFMDVAGIDDYVCKLRTGKESTRKIMVEFFDYIQNNEHLVIESELYGKHFFDYPFERQLEIAKFLHEPHTPKEIEERFGIDGRTRRNDMQVLEDGLVVLGSMIKVKKEQKGRKYYYKSTMHPIFLPLNLTEVFAVTESFNYVCSKSGIYSEILGDMTNRIKAQLTDYAFDMLYPEEEKPKTNVYLSEEELVRREKSLLSYLHKRGTTFEFCYNGQKFKGVIVEPFDPIKIKLVDGSRLVVDSSEIEVIPNSFIYE